MVTSSKILTVTYGTFSCTLEGFDDPFTTLQMVAEYFRKLAAEDRHFGGVPTVPDTETLKRIAEENSRHGVAAVVDENGITLRKDEGEAELPVFDSVRNDEGQEEQAQTAPLTFHSKRGTPAEAGTGDADAGPEEGGEGRADEVDTVGLAVAGAAGAAAAAEGLRQAAVPKSVEETLAEIRRNVRRAESDISESDEDAEDAQPAPLILTDEISEDDAEEGAAEEESAASEPEAAPAAESAEGDDEAPASEDAEAVAEEVEPEPSEEEVIAQEEVAERETALEEETAEESAEPAEPAPEEAPDDAAEMPEAEPEPVAAEAAEDVPSEESEEEVVQEEEDQITAFDEQAEQEPESPAGAYVPPANSSLTPEEEEELARDLAAAIAIDGDAAPEMEQEAGEDEGDEEVAARRRRAEALRAMAGEGDGDVVVDRLLETTRSKMDKPEQRRRLNALEQLKAAVAATEAERKVTGRASDRRAEEEQATDLAAYREDLRRARAGAPEGDAGPDVVADMQQEQQETQPEQPAESAPAPAPQPRPAAASAAPQPAAPPLILVSEQRIDEPETPGGDEAMPAREVAETDGNLALKPEAAPLEATGEADDEIQGIPADAFSEATSFSDFAERIGAFEMTDLLEAAAAYTSIVEGKQRFSRAQVMSKVARLNHGDGYSKEAGLRSFGKLLREGKILRVQDGQFGISKASRFSIASRYQE